MNARDFGSILSSLMLLVATSTFGEECPEVATTATNPITIESQIRDVTFVRQDLGGDVNGDAVMIHLIRQPYAIVAPVWLRVRTLDRRRMYACDLLKDDNVRIYGDLDHDTISAIRITLQRRVEHR
jgi:hypothetical protein